MTTEGREKHLFGVWPLPGRLPVFQRMAQGLYGKYSSDHDFGRGLHGGTGKGGKG